MKKIFFLSILYFVALPCVAAEFIATRTLAAGEIVSEEDLRWVGDGSSRAPKGEFVGLEARRAIFAGTAISATLLRPATLIKRNQIVTITFEYKGLRIRSEGRSLENGSRDDIIKILNLSSRSKILGVVRDVDLVEVFK